MRVTPPNSTSNKHYSKCGGRHTETYGLKFPHYRVEAMNRTDWWNNTDI